MLETIMALLNKVENLTSNKTENGEQMYISNGIVWSLLALHGLSAFVALVANIVVILQNVMLKKYRSKANYHITALAVSGILLILFCISLVLRNLDNHVRISGRTMCWFKDYMNTACCIQTSFIIIVSSVDRYLAICRPLQRRLSSRKVCLTIVGIWIMSGIIPLPIALFSACREAWPTTENMQLFTAVMMILTYVVPLGFLLVTFGLIYKTLDKKPPGEECAQMISRRSYAKKRAIRMFLFPFGAFFICRLPITVITAIGEADPSIYDIEIVPVVWLVTEWMELSYPAVTAIAILFTRSIFSSCLAKKFLTKDKLVPISPRCNTNETQI